MRILKLSSLIVSFLFLSNISFAQECDSTCCNKASNQIQFHLVNDYSVSYLKMVSPSTGFRFKVDFGFNGNSSDMENSNEDIYLNSTPPHYYSRKSKDKESLNSQYVNLVCNIVFINKIEEGISIYYGIGPLLSYSFFDSDVNNSVVTNYVVGDSYQTNYSEYFLGVGLQGVFGTSVSITKKISLLAEFNLNGTYGWIKNSYNNRNQNGNNRNEREGVGTSWNYGLNQLKLGIAYSF